MKTNKKLTLAELKVKSFVTSNHTFLKETVNGGGKLNPTSIVDALSEGPPSNSTDYANCHHPSNNCLLG